MFQFLNRQLLFQYFMQSITVACLSTGCVQRHPPSVGSVPGGERPTPSSTHPSAPTPTSQGPGEAISAPSNAMSSPPSSHSDGAVDGSGGNTVQSSPEQVEQVIASVKEKLKLAFHRILILEGEGNKAIEESTYALAQVLSQPSSLINEKLAQLQIRPSDEECETETGEPKKRKSSGIVCLSRLRLKTVAPEALQIQVLALAAHEFSHVLEFDETTAKGVQQWFLLHPKIVLPNLEVLRALVTDLDGISYDVAHAMKDIVGSFFDPAIFCQDRAQLQAQTQSVSDDLLLYNKFVLPNSVSGRIVKLWINLQNATYDCGILTADALRSTAIRLKMLRSLDKWVEEYIQLLPGLHNYIGPESGLPLLNPSAAEEWTEAKTMLPFLGKPKSDVPLNRVEAISCSLQSSESDDSKKSEPILLKKIEIEHPPSGTHTFEGRFKVHSIDGIKEELGLRLTLALYPWPAVFDLYVENAGTGNDTARVSAYHLDNATLSEFYGLKTKIVAALQKRSVEQFSFSFQVHSAAVLHSRPVPGPIYALRCKFND